MLHSIQCNDNNHNNINNNNLKNQNSFFVTFFFLASVPYSGEEWPSKST